MSAPRKADLVVGAAVAFVAFIAVGVFVSALSTPAPTAQLLVMLTPEQIDYAKRACAIYELEVRWFYQDATPGERTYTYNWAITGYQCQPPFPTQSSAALGGAATSGSL